MWRLEPVNVEKFSDELRLGVKCQSNAELAGSPRNVLRYSVGISLSGVKHWFGAGSIPGYQIETNSEY